MPISDELLDKLVCPRCKGELVYYAETDQLYCGECDIIYPIENEIPILLVDPDHKVAQAGGLT